MSSITAVIRTYSFRTNEGNGLNEYLKLKEKLEARGLPFFNVISDRKELFTDGETIQIETKHLFDNQFNTVDGRRGFDWYEGLYPLNRNLKKGHYLEPCPELDEARAKTLICGYCGTQYGEVHPEHKPVPDDGYCTNCLGSKYLTADDLYLLKLMPVTERWAKRPKLTETELAGILPKWHARYKQAQEERKRLHRDKEIVRLIGELEQSKRKFDGFQWLLLHGWWTTSNIIYYPHTETFCFGYSEPHSAEEAVELRERLVDFPYQFEIKEK